MDQSPSIAKKVNIYALIGMVSAALLLIQRLLAGTWYLALLVTCSLALFSSARLISYLNRNLTLASHLVVIGAYVGLLGGQFKDGGKHSICLWLISMVPLIAGDLLGLRRILGYTLLSALGVSAPWIADLIGWTYPEPIQVSDGEIVLMRVLGLVGVTAVCLQVATESDVFVGELAKKRAQVYSTHQKAQALNQEKASFLRQMSREIRAPLNGVKGMTQVWVRQELDPESAEYVGMMDRCANNLLSIINDAQNISQVGEQAWEIQMRPFSIGCMVEDVVKLFSGKAREKNIDLSAYSSTEDCYCIGDEKRLTQVLSNLVGNAIKFSDQGRVELHWEWMGSGVNFRVTDQGIGMSKSQLDSLFSEFTQVHEEESARRGGTGLGLAISKSLVEAMGGTMQVESQVGRGSCFQINLPMQATTLEALEDRRCNQNKEDVLNCRVLLLDDDLASLWVQRLALESMGCTVDCTKTTKAALDLARQTAYDLAIIDLRMPDIDGIKALALVREQACNPQQLPAIALTASAEPDDKQACLEAGFSEVLVKPFDYAELRRATSKHYAPPSTANRLQQAQ